MKRLTFLMSFFLLISINQLNAQHLTLKDVLERYYSANGIGKMKDWRTIATHGNFIYQDSIFPMKTVLKRPDKVRIEVNVKDTFVVIVFDGRKGWTIIPRSGTMVPQNMTENEIFNLKKPTRNKI